MNIHKLQNHFWQLHAVERFSGNVALLYFYWLNRFNAGFNGKFWPAEYPRWSKQVEADIGITDKPLAAARKVLEQRGLLYYLEGSKSKAPIWSLSPIIRKNSGQYEGISRINSDESKPIAPHISRNNSGQLTGLAPTLAGETPDSIRRRHKPVLEQEDTNKKNVVVSADFSEAITTLSESKRITAPYPIALPPSPTAPQLSFEDFWDAFSKKEDKHKCQQQWGALTSAEQCAAIEKVPAYVLATPEKRYRKNPLTWLNNKCWLDEE